MNLSTAMDLLLGMPAFPVLFKVTVLLALGWAAQAFLRHRHPEWRILMWRALAMGCLAIPLFDLLQPYILYEVQVPQRPISIINTPVEPAVSLPDLPASPVQRPGPYNPIPEPRAVVTQSLGDRSVAETTRTWPWASTLPGLWLAITLLGFTRLAYAWYCLHTLHNQSQAGPDDLQNLFNRVANDLGCKQSVRLRVNPHINTPYLQGIFHPKIHLPSLYMEPQYREDLPGILAHELTHMQNRDLAWKLIFESLFCLLWFHPLVWKISAVHDFACEEICDRAASRYVGSPEQYTRTLARAILDSRTLLPGCAALPFARSSTIHRRLRKLQTAITAPLSRKTVLVCSLPLLLVIGGINGIVWTEGEEESQYQPYDTMDGEEESLNKPYDAYVEEIPGYTINYNLIFDEYKRTRMFDYGEFSLSEEVLDNYDAEIRLWSQQDSQYGPLRTLRLSDYLLNGELEEMGVGFTVVDTGFYVATASTTEPTEEMKNQSQAITVTGQVMDEAGQPLSPAEVKAYVSIKNRSEEIASAQTNADGAYSLSLPQPGSYFIESSPSTDYLKKSQRLTLDADTRIEFKHAPAPLQVQGTVVEAETGQPIAGARVYMIPVHNPAGVDHHPDQTMTEGITDTKGVFKISRLATGYFAFGAEAKGHISLSPSDNDQTPNPYLRVLINEQTQSHSFPIELSKGNVVRIRVINTEKNPVAQAEVNIHVNGDLFGRYQQFSDENGECLFDTLAPGTAAALVKKASVGETISETFQSGSQENPPVITVALPKPATITGVVRDADKQPVTQRPIRIIYSELGKRIPHWRTTSGSSTQTDETGRYTFTGLGEGEYIVSVKGVGEKLRFFDVASKAIQTLIGDVTELNFDLEEKAKPSELVTIQGKIVDQNQKPIPDALVNLAVQGGEQLPSGVSNWRDESTKTNTNGVFIFSDKIKGATFNFFITRKGFAQTLRRVPYQDVPYTFVIDPAGSIQGVVVDAKTKEPIGNALATMSHHTSPQPQIAVTTAAGEFEIFDVSPQNKCSVQVTSPGYLSVYLSNITVKSGEATRLKIEMTEGCTVKGKITKNGLPVRARIEITQMEQRKLVFQTDFLSQGEGTYTVGLKSGHYTLKATSFLPERHTTPLEAEFETTFTVQEGEKEKWVDVVLP